MKTIIHNKNIPKEQEVEYQSKIQKWLKDISKVKFCKEFLNLLNQCENFTVIFDFESELVDNATFYDYAASESPYIDGTITIGTKLSSKRTEQDIKGVLARKLCLLALKLTYESTSNPYYSHDITATQNISQIIQKISNWTSEDTDKSSGIISSVIESSTRDNIQMELLATVVQILVQFNDDKEELTRFEVKFKELFDYFEIFVLSEMKNLNLKLRENVRKFNRIAGDILPCLGLELSELKDVKSLTENNFSIIQTNLPKLLLINIQKSSYKNILISSEKLQSCQELLHNLLAQDSTLNVFVTFTGAEKIDENFKNIFNSKKFTFIVSNDVQCQELAQKLTELGLNPTIVEVNYGWNDLTVDSQKLLLKMKINFQNNSEFSFLDILNDKFNPEDEEVARNFNDIVDDQLLVLMLDGSEIMINSGQGFEKIDNQANLKERKFIKKELNKFVDYRSPIGCPSAFNSNALSQDELLEDCKDAGFVILSDKPGNGKTLAMKNFAKILRQQNPTNWVTFVDLKLFVERFKDQMIARRDLEFPEFFAKTILKQHTKFEAQMFQKMYDLGKVFIFLDGLDELTPSCMDFLLKILKTFDSNEGSLLWISKCEPLEVDLDKVLELNIKYKFEELKDEDCVDLIAAGWGSEDISDSDQKLAMDLLNKNSLLKCGAIGMPQLSKMIAEITKNDKTSTTEFKELTIFREFTQMLYKNWSNLQESGTESCKLNFWSFHELMAMQISFPSFSDLCELSNEELQAWTDEMIASAGLMTKNGQSYNFLHSTYADYFIAEFILKTLKQEEVSSWFLQFLMKVLTTRRYQTIRIFLDQGIGNVSDLQLSDKTIKDLTANIDEFTNISYVFMEGLENLQKFLVMCLNRRRYKVVKSIIESNIEAIFAAMRRSEVPLNPQIFLDFIAKFLNPKCLQSLIKGKKLFPTIIESCEDIEHFEMFANIVKKKINADFVVQSFKGNRRARHPNIFFTFCWSKNLDSQKIQKFLKILKGFLNMRKIMDLLQIKSKWNCRCIFNDTIDRGDPEVFKILWTEIENFYKSNESHRKFKELVTSGGNSRNSILQTVANSTDIKMHKMFWEITLETLGKEALKDFINFENTSFTDYFLAVQMSNSDNPQIIEFTFEKLQEIFSYEEVKEIIEHKPYAEGNLILRAAERSNKFEIFVSVWNFMRKFCKTDEEFIKQVIKRNEYGTDILASAVRSHVHEIFSFIIRELKTITKPENIKPMLTNIDNNCQNILFNFFDTKLFLTVWDVICEFLCPSEILEIFINLDCSDQNFISNINSQCYHNNEFLQDVWTVVKKFILEHEIMSTELTENIKKCDNFARNWVEFRNQNKPIDEVIKLKWLRTKSLRLLDCPETLKLQISQSELFSCAYDFHVLANCENFEIHETCWQFILKKYENCEDLVKLMTQRSVSGSTFIHSIMSNKNIEAIKLVLKIIQENFNKAQILEILSIKNIKGSGLLTVAAFYSKNLQIVETLWTLHQKCFSSSELIDFMTQNNNAGANAIFYIAGSTVEIFNFIWAETEKLLDPNDSQTMVKLVMQRNNSRQNILHPCVDQHDIQLLQVVWNKVTKVLGGSIKSIFKLAEVNKNGHYDWYNDVLDILGAATECEKIEFHEALWGHFWESFKAQDELKSIVLWKKDEEAAKIVEKVEDDSESSCSEQDEVYSQDSDYYRYNKHNSQENEPFDYNAHANKTSIYYFLKNIYDTASFEVIKLVMLNFNKLLSKNEICQILVSTGYNCFLVNDSEDIERHQLMWDIYRQYLTIPDLKNFANNFFCGLICCAVNLSIEIFKFNWNEVKKEAESILIQALESDQHIIRACIEHKDIETLKYVWMEVKKFYEAQNLPESFKEFVLKRRYNQSVLEAADKVWKLEVHEVLWELLLSAFENREELKDILVRKDEYYGCLIGDCFRIKNLKVVEFLIKIFEASFTDSQLKALLSADANMLINLLSENKKNFEVFKVWWEFFKKIFNNSQKFVEFVELNGNFETIFGYGCHKTLELFFNDMKFFTTREEIRKNLLKVNKEKENILHMALKWNNNFPDDYKSSWLYIHEYLEPQEILNLLTQIDEYKSTFLFHVVVNHSKKILEVTWNEMKKVLSPKEQIKFLKSRHPSYGSLYHCVSMYAYPREEKMAWIEATFRKHKIRMNK